MVAADAYFVWLKETHHCDTETEEFYYANFAVTGVTGGCHYGPTRHIATPEWSWKCNATFLVAVGPMNPIEMLLCKYSNERMYNSDHIYHEKDKAFHLLLQYQENLQEETFSIWHNGPVCVPILIAWTIFKPVNMKIYLLVFLFNVQYGTTNHI